MCACVRSCVCVCVCVCCVGRWAIVGMDVCVRLCGGASAVLAVLHGRDLHIFVSLANIYPCILVMLCTSVNFGNLGKCAGN